MGEVKHTPGPWKVGYRAFDIVAPNPKGGEAKIFDVRGWGFLTGKGHGALGLPEVEAEAIQRANARLAAAAPDLLKALIDLEAYVRETPHHNALEAAAARKAIAKAVESSHGA